MSKNESGSVVPASPPATAAERLRRAERKLNEIRDCMIEDREHYDGLIHFAAELEEVAASLRAALTADGRAATPSELDATIRDVCQRHLAQRALWDRYSAGEASDKLIDDIFASAAAVGAAIDRLRTAAGHSSRGAPTDAE